MTLDEALQAAPLVAILRGVKPDEVLAIAEALYAVGVRAIEVPMNSPEPLESIRRLGQAMGDRVVHGAGTVLSAEAVDQVADAGGRLIVSPNADPAVIARTVELGLASMPGFTTATEAFAAYRAGARKLKLFPASAFSPAYVKALLEVLPRDASLFGVGGIGPDDMAEWMSAGMAGFGLGGSLYKPGRSSDEVGELARTAVAAVLAARDAAVH